MMNTKGIRIAVVLADLFEAASAIAGAIGLVVGFMNIPASVLIGTPFSGFTVPAMLLGAVVGGSALLAGAVTALGPRQFGAPATAIAGCVTVGWLAVEIAMIGLGSWLQVFYLFVGLLMIGGAGLLWLADTHTTRVIGAARA